MQIQPYLFFDGTCEAAAAFYQRTVGAEVLHMSRYRDMPEPRPPGMVPPGSEDKVMHMTMKIGASTVMAADDCTDHPRFSGFSLSLEARDAAEAQRLFEALADGGQVRMPLTQTFFAQQFGMLTDRFGVGWMVITGA